MTDRIQIPFKKALVLGANGQLGKAFRELLDPQICVFATRGDLDLSAGSHLRSFFQRVQPDVVINAAAYTQVDLAEKEAALAEQINSVMPGAMAIECFQRKIPFLHFSTDYVFKGDGTQPWKETDPVQPLNAYGKTKLLGEQAIEKAGGNYLIFRTSWVYDAQGKNFLTTMLRLGKEKSLLRIVDDQIGAPTFALDLARGALRALNESMKMPAFPSGVYHLCNSGETSWFHFAESIFENARKKKIPLRIEKLEPILSADFPTPAIRPKNSRLNNEKMSSTFKVRLPHWRESLAACMENL